MIRILHTNDLHLGAAFPEFAECAAARRVDQLETFHRILDLAIREKVQLLVVAGDLFASPWPTADLVTRVHDGFQRLRDHGILSIVLPGSSDAPRFADSIYEHHDFAGALIFDPRDAESATLDIGGESLHVCSGRVANDRIVWPESVSAETGGVRLGLFYDPHASSRHSDAEAWLDGASWQEWDFNYLICGGLHHYREWHQDGHLVGCCAGTPEGLAFWENGVRCCVLACIGTEQVTAEKHPVNTRVFKDEKLDLKDISSQDELVERIRSLGHPDVMMRLTLTGQPTMLLHVPYLQRQVADAFCYLEIDDRIQFMNSPLAEEWAGRNRPSGVLVRKAQALAARRSEKERQVLDRALREILVRCQTGVGESL
jgi:DNA repair exonuclease SbcCD nuclease subunit